MKIDEQKDLKKFILFCTGIQLVIIGAALAVSIEWGNIMVSIFGAGLILFSETKGELD